MKYLHQTSPHHFYLDHRLTPEVRACLLAMTSRMPVGGLVQRYTELLNSVDEDLLCSYPLPEKVRNFFDEFVGQYGHSSILELSGNPAIYADGLSWWTAYLLFDNPLVSGQENSTRAVSRKGWPICREANNDSGGVDEHLADIHDFGMSIFEEELELWKNQFLGTDKQPFRPALDRARWALPGTISTGVAFSSNVRERSRSLRDAWNFYQGSSSAFSVIEELFHCYTKSVPGLAQLGLSEAWYNDCVAEVPKHLQIFDNRRRCGINFINVDCSSVCDELLPDRMDTKSYADPLYNRIRCDVRIVCSVSAARDWHRHRTFYPMIFRLIDDGSFSLYPSYEQRVGSSRQVDYYNFCYSDFHYFSRFGDMGRAMLCIPFGATVELEFSCGLRDLLYAAELRAFSSGANFEYKKQAEFILSSLVQNLPISIVNKLKIEGYRHA